MQVVAVLIGSLFLYRAWAQSVCHCSSLGSRGRVSLLPTMLVFTAFSHFPPMKRNLIAMVPPSLPRP